MVKKCLTLLYSWFFPAIAKIWGKGIEGGMQGREKNSKSFFLDMLLTAIAMWEIAGCAWDGALGFICMH